MEGKFPPDCAVLCSKIAGDAYGLKLLLPNLEDETSRTAFGLYRSLPAQDRLRNSQVTADG